MVIFSVRAETSKNALSSGLPIQKTNMRTENQPFEDVSSPIKKLVIFQLVMLVLGGVNIISKLRAGPGPFSWKLGKKYITASESTLVQRHLQQLSNDQKPFLFAVSRG